MQGQRHFQVHILRVALVSNPTLPPKANELAQSSRWAVQPLIGVKRKVWRNDDEHAALADAAFADARKEVFARDNYTCRFCAFRAAKYQEIHHWDDDHKNNGQDNLVTVCTLCHQTHHLGMFSMRNAGFLAIIPELTQTEVNEICRVIHVTSLFDQTAETERLQGLFTAFQMRGADTLKKAFDCDISNPYLLTQVLSQGEETLFSKRGEALTDLRLISNKSAFHAGQLEYYAQNCRDQFTSNTWQSLGKQMLEVLT